jgi:hypothetical protein
VKRGLFVGLLIVIAVSVALLIAQRGTRPIPEVRGVILGGDAGDRERLSPLLEAGFCVAFRYDGTSSEVTGPDLSYISDAYFIGDESPQPGHWWNRRPKGSAVTVIVRGIPLGGPEVDWDTMPEICP